MALSNAQYNEIMKVYGDRQLRSYREQQERIRKAYGQVPALSQLDAQIAGESVAAAEALMAGDRSRKAGLRDRIRQLSGEKQRLLQEAGFPENYLERWYTCADCQDTGFIDGKKCHCFQAMQSRLLYRQSNVEKLVQVQNFEHFDLSIFDNREPISMANGKTNRDYMRYLRDALQKWCREFDAKHGSIILMGGTGTGKTFLINCVTKALLDSYHSVIYFTSTDLIESFGRMMKDEGEQELSEALLQADLLVIDDLGTELVNSFTTSKLFYVLNQRMILGKSVIISTNLSFKSMRDIYSDRIVSRIMSEYEIVPLYGRDQRL